MHLRDLKELAERFRASHPYVIAAQREPKPDPSQGVNYFFVLDRVDAVPAQIGLVAGDVLTNLRAALDHLAWDLVAACPPDPPDDYTAFPIKDKPPRAPGSGTPTQLRISGGVSAKALTAIEAAQPYNRPDGGTIHDDRLWILDRLVGIDKHRHLLLTQTAYDRVAFTTYGIRRNMPVMAAPRPLENDAYIGTFFTPDLQEQVDVDIDLTTAITLRQSEPGGNQQLVMLLGRILKRIRDEIVPSFDGMC